METYSIYKAAEILGMNHLKLREWFKYGHIPLDDERKAEGPGYKTELHREDLYKINLFDLLRNYGMSREKIKKVFQESKNKIDQWNGYLFFAQRRGGDIIFDAVDVTGRIRKMPTLEINFKNGTKREVEAGTALIINLKLIKDEVDSLISG